VGASWSPTRVCAVSCSPGPTEVARIIQRRSRRDGRHGARVPLVAETGGQNAMIVDSSALPEQVVADAISSAFDSAGQRCSALRVLCLQEESPSAFSRCCGRDGGARDRKPRSPFGRRGAGDRRRRARDARAYVEKMRAQGLRVYRPGRASDAGAGHFIAPTLIEIDRIETLEREVFGPVLHVLRFRREGSMRWSTGSTRSAMASRSACIRAWTRRSTRSWSARAWATST
jgi:RHH-type proline utilization regulon transcriptional repressor/proline dehydrogenase/delta 1-pyrroline-5-carboxylate dehydrogenase